MDYSALSASELVQLCFRSQDESAWVEFVRRFHPLIAKVAMRVARQWGEHSVHVVDDLVQNTYLKLCADRNKLLQNFTPSYPDAVYGYIKVFTANLVHDYFKAGRSQKRDNSVTGSLESKELSRSAARLATPGDAHYETVLLQQIDACLKSISPGAKGMRDRRIFWLYYRVGLSAAEIAALPSTGIGAKGVESTLHRLNQQLKEELARRRREPEATEGDEKGNSASESF